MKKLIKVIGIVAVIIVVGIAAVLIAAKIVITPDRVRQVVIPRAEEQLNRPVSIGDINVRIFSGILISDFVIGSKDNTADFVSADTLVLRYRFWPLLRFSVVVDEARLDSPDIRVERYKSGEFNFSDLIADPGAAEDIDREPPDIAVDENGVGRQIDLVVNEISISGGRLVFVDHMVDREYQLTDLSASATGFSLDRPFPFDISAKIDNAPLDLAGTINLQTNHVSANIRIKEMDVAAFMPYAPEDFPGKLSSMKLSMDIQTNATPQTVDSSGRIILNDMDLLIDDMPDIPIEIARLTLDYVMDIDLVSEKLTIEKADANINGILMAASGNVLYSGTEPILDLTARLPMTSFSDIVASAPPKLVEPLIDMRPAGRLGATFHISGSFDKPETLIEEGEITLDKIGVTINELAPDISGVIVVEKDTATSDNLVINHAGDIVHMNFTANNLMGPIIRAKHSMTADRLDIGHVLDALGIEETEVEHPPDEPPVKAEEPGPFDFPIEIIGDTRIANLFFQNLTLTNFDLQYQFSDNVLTINRLHGDIAGGTVSGNARAELNLKPIAYHADISITDTRAEKIINALYPGAANTLFGTMFLNINMKGKGTSWEIIRQNITSRADLNITDGSLTGEGLAGGLAGFLGTERLEVIRFDSMEGNVELEEGNFKVDSRVHSNEFRMTPTGTIALDGSLNLSLDLRLAPQIASQIRIGDLYSRLARTHDGWTLVPLEVAGKLWAPSFKLDTSAISDQLMERGKEELRKQLQDKVFDRLIPQVDENSDKEPDKEERAPLERKLEDTFRRLFK